MGDEQMRLHETLNVLLDYLENTGRSMCLKGNDFYIEDVTLRVHAYVEEIPDMLDFSLGHACDKTKGRYLELATQEGHTIWADLKDVDTIYFDAIISNPETGKEMKECLDGLEADGDEPYNVYLVQSKGTKLEGGTKPEKWILDFFRIELSEHS